YRAGEMDKGLAMVEMQIIEENIAQNFYGKIVDQNGRPVVGATVTASAIREAHRNEPIKFETDQQGLFNIEGLRGRSININPTKPGYEISGHGLGLRNVN